MECAICGKSYSLAHECAGPQKLSEKEAAPPPAGFAPLYYLQLAAGIMRWNDLSVRRASRDPRALLYGAFIWLAAAAIVFYPAAVTAAAQGLRQANVEDLTGVVAVIVGIPVLIIVLVAVAVLFVLQVGLCHLIAKWFFHGKGRFIGILRPLTLGWPINILSLIPVLGPIAAALLWAAVLMVVFEEVNHIRRVHAFAISYGVNLLILAVGRSLF